MNNRLQNRQNCCRETGNIACGESTSYDQLQMMPLAMAYVPWQQWQNVYECSKGFEHGSIFEELIFPFQHASRVCKNMHECRNNERMGCCEPRESCRNINNIERTQPYECMQHCGRRCD